MLLGINIFVVVFLLLVVMTLFLVRFSARIKL